MNASSAAPRTCADGRSARQARQTGGMARASSREYAASAPVSTGRHTARPVASAAGASCGMTRPRRTRSWAKAVTAAQWRIVAVAECSAGSRSARAAGGTTAGTRHARSLGRTVSVCRPLSGEGSGSRTDPGSNSSSS